MVCGPCDAVLEEIVTILVLATLEAAASLEAIFGVSVGAGGGQAFALLGGGDCCPSPPDLTASA